MGIQNYTKEGKAYGFILKGLYNEWIKSGLSLINQSYGLSAAGASLYLGLGHFSDSYFNRTHGGDLQTTWLAGTSSNYQKKEIRMNINMDYWSEIDRSDINGYGTRTTGYFDRSVAHELVHGLMGINMPGHNSNNAIPHYIKEGMSELVHGIDDFRNLKQLNSTNFRSMLYEGSYGNMTSGWYRAGYVWLRYMAFQGTNWRKSKGVSQQDVIRDFVNELKKGKSLDDAVRTATGTGNTAEDITKQIVEHIDDSNFLKGRCSIDLSSNNTDTGSITGYDTGLRLNGTRDEKSVKTATSVVSESKDYVYWSSASGWLYSSFEDALASKKKEYIYTEVAGVKVYFPTELTYAKAVTSKGTAYLGSSKLSEIITADSGNTTLWGGGVASDTLSGGSYSNTTYMFGSGDGNDVVQGGTWGSSGDLLYLRGGLKSKKFDGSDLQLTLKAGDTLTLEGVGSQAVRFTTNGKTVKKAEFGVSGAEMQFDSDVNYYLPGSGSTLKIGSGAKVWMEGSHAKASFGNNFSVLDGSSSSGSLLIAGKGSVSETLMGGSGSCSLWGGSGKSNDTLVGGSGQNSFYYLKNNGNDVITEADASDRVVLYNAKKSDIGNVSFQDGGMSLSMKAGGTLTINSVDDSTTFVLKGGAAYQHSGGKWHKA